MSRYRASVLLIALAVLPGYAEPDDVPKQVAALVQKVKPTEAVAWTKIPWVASLAEARAISQKEGVPVFLFAHEGNIGLNRC